MAPELDALARRAELAGLNAASAPREAQVEGWLLRLSPGKAKRSRCVNALAGGTLPLDDLLRRCRPSFEQAGLPLILRITPSANQRISMINWPRKAGPASIPQT
ncbi:hypothetical protein ACQ859_02435 [Roseateles chitinivorans]|uniref:hypothetical protein n=1 Tax=Roseateles chitinivorans TaxID=2917965 RepID=UPI003D676837